MLISNQTVVALSYTVTDTLGEVLSHSAKAEEFLIGSDDLLPAIQELIKGQTVGFTAKVQLEPNEAFGEYDANLNVMEPRRLFPETVAEGVQFEGLPAGCTSVAADAPHRIYTVTDVTEEVVILDGNHPLAGIAVRFELTVTGVREGTLDEIGAGTTLRGTALSVVSTHDVRNPNSYLH